MSDAAEMMVIDEEPGHSKPHPPSLMCNNKNNVVFWIIRCEKRIMAFGVTRCYIHTYIYSYVRGTDSLAVKKINVDATTITTTKKGTRTEHISYQNQYFSSNLKSIRFGFNQ